MDNNAKIGKRCRALRKKEKLTLEGLYDKLQITIAIMNEKEPFIPKNKEEEAILPANRRGVISKIESGYGLSLNNALAYSKYFNVSLNYLYFGEKSYKPEYEQLKEMLGLSDDALHNLEKLNNTNKQAINTLNKLLSPKLFPIFEELINDYSEHSTIDIKSHIMNYPGTVRYEKSDVSPLVLKYINLDSKGLERLSKETISDCSKKLADEIKRQGDK